MSDLAPPSVAVANGNYDYASSAARQLRHNIKSNCIRVQNPVRKLIWKSSNALQAKSLHYASMYRPIHFSRQTVSRLPPCYFAAYVPRPSLFNVYNLWRMFVCILSRNGRGRADNLLILPQKKQTQTGARSRNVTVACKSQTKGTLVFAFLFIDGLWVFRKCTNHLSLTNAVIATWIIYISVGF